MQPTETGSISAPLLLSVREVHLLIRPEISSVTAAQCKAWMHIELTPGATYLFNNGGTYESKFTLTYVSNITFKLSKSFWFCC